MAGGVCGSAYDGVDVQAGEVNQEKRNSTGHLFKALKLRSNCEATMDGFDQNKFHWKRILVIMTIMTLISYLMGKMPSRESQLKNAVVAYSKTCPVYFENGLSLDSVNLSPSAQLNYYFSDKTSIGENLDSTQFVTMVKHFYQTTSDNNAFTRFLNDGYKLNFMLLKKDSSVLQIKLDSKKYILQ